MNMLIVPERGRDEKMAVGPDGIVALPKLQWRKRYAFAAL